MNIKIAIADDHKLFSKGIANILKDHAHLELTHIYSNGEELLEHFKTEQPDVLLLDIQMPGKSGEQIAAILSKKYPQVKMIALTGFDSGLYINNMLLNGVSGYLLKTSDESVLITAIETVYNGGTYIDDIIKEKAFKQQQSVKRSVALKSALSPRELEILTLIAQGFTSPQISEKLFLSLHTVNNYRDNIHLKLDVNNMAALIAKAIRLGLID